MKIIVSFLLLLTLIPSAFANDSSAVLAAGGLVLTQNKAVSMTSEKLLISPKKIKIDYNFTNHTNQAVTTLVAFPLPTLDVTEMMERPVLIDEKNPHNFVDFTATVEGKRVSVQQKLVARFHQQEITQTLLRYHVPLSPFEKDFSEKLAKLPKAVKQQLAAKHWIEMADTDVYPRWTLETSYYWHQTFPAHQVVHIHHEYQPVVGQFFFGYSSFADTTKPFCIDSDTHQGITKMLGRPTKENEYPYITGREIQYILTTGANWSGPIQSFELIIDKEAPTNLLSTCITGLKKVSPTQFKLSYRNFKPKQNLRILILNPLHIN